MKYLRTLLYSLILLAAYTSQPALSATRETDSLTNLPSTNLPADPGTNNSVSANQPPTDPTGSHEKPDSSSISAKPPSVPYWVFFMTGAEFQNPYEISVNVASNRATLTNSGSHTVPVLEFDFLNKYVLRNPKKMDEESPDKTSPFGKAKFLGGYVQNPLAHLPDISLDMGFVFNSGTSSTTYSASTVAGSGDFYTDGSLGLPLWRAERKAMRQQVTLDFSGGVSTDREFLAVHPNMVFGLGYQTSFRPFYNTSSNVPGFFASRIGAGWADVPSMTGSDSNVALDSDGNPEFKFRAAPALEAVLAVPLTSAIFLTARANVFMESRPASWNIFVGATIPIDSLQSVFKSFISPSQ